MLIPGTHVRRDGRQLRMDAVHRNDVFLYDTQFGGLRLDITTGTTFRFNYHPYDLVFKTRDPSRILAWLRVSRSEEESGRVTLSYVRQAQEYMSNIHKLSAIEVPETVIPSYYIQLVEAFVQGVPTEKLFQGVKTAFGIELPKMIQNYLNGGYHWEDKSRSLECFVLQAIKERGLVVTLNRKHS